MSGYSAFSNEPPRTQPESQTPCRKCAGTGQLTTPERPNPEWLKWVRHRWGVKAVDFALWAQVTPSMISQVESGKTTCTPHLLKIYEYFLTDVGPHLEAYNGSIMAWERSTTAK